MDKKANGPKVLSKEIMYVARFCFWKVNFLKKINPIILKLLD